jgi:hypothetical protein
VDARDFRARRLTYDITRADGGADVLLIHAGVNDRRSSRRVIARLKHASPVCRMFVKKTEVPLGEARPANGRLTGATGRPSWCSSRTATLPPSRSGSRSSMTASLHLFAVDGVKAEYERCRRVHRESSNAAASSPSTRPQPTQWKASTRAGHGRWRRGCSCRGRGCLSVRRSTTSTSTSGLRAGSRTSSSQTTSGGTQ